MNYKTLADQINEEKMPSCARHPENKAVFFCNDLKCEDNALPYYCLDCSEDRHNHRNVKIQTEATKCLNKWASLFKQIEDLYHIAS